MILHGLPVDGPDLLVLAHALVETLAALVAQPAAFHDLLEKRLQHEAVAPWIVGRHVVEVARHERPDVEPDDVQKPVARALGQPDRRTSERIRLLDGVALLYRELVHRRAEERADAVSDEVGGVLA